MRVRAAEERDAGAIARVHVAVWREAYAGIMQAEFLADLSETRRAVMWASTIRGEGPPDAKVFVAEDPAHGIVGFAMAGRERTGHAEFDAELWAINVAASHHRRGLGRMLTMAAARWLAEAGRRSMLLWVLEANPACGFYERLGGTRLAETRAAAFGGASLTEVAYGWPSLPALVGRLEAWPPEA